MTSILDRLSTEEAIPLGSFTDEEFAAIHADEGIPFHPAGPPQEFAGLSEDAQTAAMRTALRSLIARGAIAAPSDEQLGAAARGERVELQALGELGDILTIRRGPTALAFVIGASYLALVHGFRSDQGNGFLEEEISTQGIHRFTLRTPKSTVDALAGRIDPQGLAPKVGAPLQAVGSTVPPEVAGPLRELAPGATRIEAYHDRPEGNRKLQLSVLVQPERTWAVDVAFGVAPYPARVLNITREGLNRSLAAVLSDEEAAGGGQPQNESFQCPVCGYPGLTEAPRDPEAGASYEICPSCGYQFGYDDEATGVGYDEWRQRWIAAGMPWSSRGRPRPEGWDPRAQLQRLAGQQ